MDDGDSVVSRPPPYTTVACDGCEFRDCQRPVGFVVRLGTERRRREREKVLAKRTAGVGDNHKKTVTCFVANILDDDQRDSEMATLAKEYERIVLVTRMAIAISLDNLLEPEDESFLEWARSTGWEIPDNGLRFLVEQEQAELAVEAALVKLFSNQYPEYCRGR